MNREIKFRAWYDNKMYEPVFVWWLQVPMVHNNNFDIVNLCAHTEEYHIMQYTWLKDKKWKEIYEWDIVNIYWKKEYNAIIIYEWCEFKKKYIIDNKTWNLEILIKATEVIWNIYENSELIKP